MTWASVLRRRGVVALLVLAAVPLLLAADHGLERLLAGPRGVELGGAEWIWAPRVSSWSWPTAFLALHDLELAAAPSSARLLVLADEEYVLFVNGEIVGAGRYRAGEPMDAYDLAPLLRPGNNRIAFELRSGRAIGDFLARLRVELPGREPAWRSPTKTGGSATATATACSTGGTSRCRRCRGPGAGAAAVRALGPAARRPPTSAVRASPRAAARLGAGMDARCQAGVAAERRSGAGPR